jgi:hypothetical protein
MYMKRQLVTDALEVTGKEIINISFDQMNHFAGNMLEIKSVGGDALIVMSQSAYHSLTDGADCRPVKSMAN